MKVINLGGSKYGLFVGKDGQYIISHDDVVHALYKSGEKANLIVKSGFSKMESGKSYSFAELDEMDERRLFSLEELLGIASEVDVWDFVDYWGIKDRIHRNYNLLLKSMREIGASTKNMPKWGEKE